MEKYYYYLNPHYSFERHDNRVIVYEDFNDLFSDIHYSIQFQTTIHPYHAKILSFFKGGDDLHEIIRSISEFFSLDKEKVKKFVLSFIENKTLKTVVINGKELVFPENVIVKLPYMDDKIRTYNVEDFTTEKIDLRRMRFSRPRTVGILPTFRCFTNCIYCFEDRKNPNSRNNLPIENIVSVVEQCKEWGVKTMEVMGGDNFCHPEWEKMYDAVYSNGYSFLTSTKVPLKELKIIKLKELGIRRIQFSLDSMQRDTLCDMLRVNGKYLDLVKGTFDLLEKYNIKVDVHTILTQRNSTKEDVISIYKFLENKKNINEWRLDEVYPSFFSEFKYTDLVPDKIQLAEVKKAVDSVDIGKVKIIYSVDKFYEKVDSHRDTDKRYKFLFSESIRCPANYSQMTILPDGKVTICSKLYWAEDFIIGDIKKNTLKEIWNSKKAIELFDLRRNTRESSRCHSCEDNELCNSRSAVCYMNVLAAYGLENYDYPDPNCYNAPDPVVDSYYAK